MLRHEDNPEENAIPAAQVRVTPQELAAALARLEARQEAGQRHLDGTVPLGEAMQQLGLDATPDELLREIEAGRVRERDTPRRSGHPRALRLSGAVAACLLAATGLLTFRLTRSTPLPSPLPTISAPVTTQAAPLTVPATLLVRDAGGKMVLLSEAADNQPVLCGLSATDKGAAFAGYAPDGLNWTLIKHGGQVYVRGWIADISDTALRAGTVEIYPGKGGVPTGMKPVPVTLPPAASSPTPDLPVTI